MKANIRREGETDWNCNTSRIGKGQRLIDSIGPLGSLGLEVSYIVAKKIDQAASSAKIGITQEWQKISIRPGASRSQSMASTRRPDAAKSHATLASIMVRPTPPLNE